jgi:phospholipid/cholesterol/gamma-HCH transport system substrate-binding protein
MTLRNGSLALVIASVLAVSSCSSLDVNALPAPGNSYSGGYDIVLQFDNVLNLPARAKVTLGGTTVGVVTGVAIDADHVNVTMRIEPDVVVPSNIHAVLQQATVLGDIYVALERPQTASAGAALRPGGIVPLAQTTSPSELEDTIAHLADFVGSGSIQRIQNTIISLNRVTPGNDDLRKLTSQFAADILDLSNNIDNVDLLLHGVSETGRVLRNRIPSIQHWFSPEGMRGFDRGVQAISLVGYAFPSLGTIYSGGFWLVPVLNSMANAVGAIQRDKQTFEADYPAWRRLFTNYFLPQDKYPAINITSIVGPDGRELSDNVQDVLRILGAMP